MIFFTQIAYQNVALLFSLNLLCFLVNRSQKKRDADRIGSVIASRIMNVTFHTAQQLNSFLFYIHHSFELFKSTFKFWCRSRARRQKGDSKSQKTFISYSSACRRDLECCLPGERRTRGLPIFDFLLRFLSSVFFSPTSPSLSALSSPSFPRR